MKKKGSKGQPKEVWIELLRIIACFCVIVNHTNSQVFLNTTPSLEWFISLAYFFVSKIAVPIFVMISGYLLLEREDTYQKHFFRIVRITAVLLLFSLFYYVNDIKAGQYTTYSIGRFLYLVMKNPMTGSFWYLYMYIGLLMMLPFLQKMVKGMKKIDFYVFFSISFLFYGIWPIVIHYVPELAISSELDMPLFSGYLTMFLMGYYLKKYSISSYFGKLVSIFLLCLATAFNVMVTYLEYSYVSQDNYLFLDDRTLFPIILASGCVFYLIKDMKFKEKISVILSEIGACTFGIFLFSDYLIGSFEFVYLFICNYVSPIVSVVIWEMSVFGVGFMIVFLLRKLPIVKKIL